MAGWCQWGFSYRSQKPASTSKDAGVTALDGNQICMQRFDCGPRISGGHGIMMRWATMPPSEDESPISTAVPAAGLSGHFFLKVDNRDRYASGGTQLTPINVNIDGGTGSISQLFVGAVTTVAPSPAARLLCRGVIRSAIPVVNDEYVFRFGSVVIRRM